MKVPININKLTEDQAKELLLQIINKLDELSADDFFGTEGWKKFMDIED